MNANHNGSPEGHGSLTPFEASTLDQEPDTNTDQHVWLLHNRTGHHRFGHKALEEQNIGKIQLFT